MKCDKTVFDNISTILLTMGNHPPSMEAGSDAYVRLNRTSTKSSITPKSLLRRSESAWLALLSSPQLTDQIRKTLLRQCTKSILPWMTRPETLMDFLTDSYNVGGSTSLLALSGLFALISAKNLDYPSFYPKLYSLLDADLLHSKHRSRFLRLLNTFLDSSHLPSTLVASFIKRLSRLSLFAPPAAIVAVIPYIYNLLRSHPTCTYMIHRPAYPPYTASTDNLGLDPFDMNEPDPQQTHAIDSSLWELETLQSHFHPNVASLARIISGQFTKQQYNLEDFLDHGYASMVNSELTSEAKKAPVVEYKIPKRILRRAPTGLMASEEVGELSLLQSLWAF